MNELILNIIPNRWISTPRHKYRRNYLVLGTWYLVVVPPKYSLKGFILEVCCRDWSLISVLV